MEGLDEKVQPLKTKTSLLSVLFKSLTCKYDVISGSSSNLEFLHFKTFKFKFLNLKFLPTSSFISLFFELNLSKIFISTLLPK